MTLIIRREEKRREKRKTSAWPQLCEGGGDFTLESHLLFLRNGLSQGGPGHASLIASGTRDDQRYAAAHYVTHNRSTKSCAVCWMAKRERQAQAVHLQLVTAPCALCLVPCVPVLTAGRNFCCQVPKQSCLSGRAGIINADCGVVHHATGLLADATV